MEAIEEALSFEDIERMVNTGTEDEMVVVAEELADAGVWVEYNTFRAEWRMETCRDYRGEAMVTGEWRRDYREALKDAAAHHREHCLF